MKKVEFTDEQKDYICYQIEEWYLNWKIRVAPGVIHHLGAAKEHLKGLIFDDREDSCEHEFFLMQSLEAGEITLDEFVLLKEL